MKTVNTKNPEETWQLAKEILENSNSNVFALFGDLGSGKTTFTQGIARALGVKRQVQSPTFLVMRQYEVSRREINRLVHVDLYRLESGSNFSKLGVEEGFEDPKILTIIEWAEKMEEKLPQKRVDVTFEYIDEKRRKITVNELT